LASKVARNTAGVTPVVGDSLYDLFYKIAQNTAGTPPQPGDRLYNLFFKIASNTGGDGPEVGDGRHNLLFKICENTEDGGGGGTTPEPEAVDFFARAGITDFTQKSAVNNLVVALKAANIWGKIRALYPLVGGTRSAHSQNLKGTAYTIAWESESNDANGVTGNATCKGDTGLNASSLAVGSVALGVYNVTGGNDPASEISAYQSGNDFSLTCLWTDNITYANMGTSGNSISVTGIDPKGFWVMNNSALEVSANMTLYRNGSLLNSKTIPSNAGPNLNYLLIYGCSRTIALAFFSDGLSQPEVVSLSSAVQAFQTTLGRNV